MSFMEEFGPTRSLSLASLYDGSRGTEPDCRISIWTNEPGSPADN